MVETFLKGISTYDSSLNDYFFSPQSLNAYLERCRGDSDPFANHHIDQLIRGLQDRNSDEITTELMFQCLHEHKIYLSRDEIETFMTVIADEGTHSVDSVTPEILKKAILKAKGEETAQAENLINASPRKIQTPRVRSNLL